MSDHMKILVVDDDPDMLALTSAVLSLGGYDVIEASTGKDALEAVAAARPDLVVLDVVLPDMSGFDVCKQIKSDPGLRSTFVALLSGLSTSSEAQTTGLDIGADGYIVKGIPNSELLARVNSLLRIKKAEDALQQANDELDQRVRERTAELAVANDALAERLGFETILADVSGNFVNLPADRIDSEIESAQRRIGEFFNLDRSTLWQSSRVESRAPFLLTHVYQLSEVDAQKGLVADDLFPWTVQKVLTGQILVIAKSADLPPEAAHDRESYTAFNTKSALIIPLSTGGRVFGALTFATMREERDWPATVVKQLHVIAELFANALARRRADDELRRRLEEIEELKQQLERENIYLQKEVSLLGEHNIVGQSAPMKTVLTQAGQVARTDSTVLILGETGTGKELLARAIHKMSARKNRPLVTVNCASLAPTLMESELFGREKGAYTGAMTSMAGRFEVANGSTLFLDEIGELPLELQVKLLRVLEEGIFERLGSTRPIHVDVRLIAATNRDFAQEVKEGRLRKDLYYRLNVFPIRIPPLRERHEDIPLLVWAFVSQFQEKMGKRIDSIAKKSMDALQSYPWPGNVRELRNVIERAMILSHAETLEITLPRITGADSSLDQNLEDVERRHIISVLEKTNWRVTGKDSAAEILGLKRSTLQSMMKKLGIERPTR